MVRDCTRRYYRNPQLSLNISRDDSHSFAKTTISWDPRLLCSKLLEGRNSFMLATFFRCITNGMDVTFAKSNAKILNLRGNTLLLPPQKKNISPAILKITAQNLLYVKFNIDFRRDLPVLLGPFLQRHQALLHPRDCFRGNVFQSLSFVYAIDYGLVVSQYQSQDKPPLVTTRVYDNLQEKSEGQRRCYEL